MGRSGRPRPSRHGRRRPLRSRLASESYREADSAGPAESRHSFRSGSSPDFRSQLRRRFRGRLVGTDRSNVRDPAGTAATFPSDPLAVLVAGEVPPEPADTAIARGSGHGGAASAADALEAWGSITAIRPGGLH